MTPMRKCWKCGSPEVTSPRGRPVCKECKTWVSLEAEPRMCAICGKPAEKRMGIPRCAICRPVKAEARYCYRGCGRKALNPTGKPLCGPCRQERICVDCGQRTEGLRASRCEPCNVARSANRPKLLKECKDCGRDIRSKSNGNYCTKCDHERQKHPCPDCGKRIDRRSKQCSQCWGAAHKREKAPSWRGGRTVMLSHGYVLVQCREHPKSGKGGYMREHVLVMEEMLGRYLLPGESVHHRDGNRQRNDPENLELWIVSQPAGQRVEDRVDNALEILRRYRPHLLRSPLTSPSLVVGAMPRAGTP